MPLRWCRWLAATCAAPLPTRGKGVCSSPPQPTRDKRGLPAVSLVQSPRNLAHHCWTDSSVHSRSTCDTVIVVAASAVHFSFGSTLLSDQFAHVSGRDAGKQGRVAVARGPSTPRTLGGGVTNEPCRSRRPGCCASSWHPVCSARSCRRMADRRRAVGCGRRTTNLFRQSCCQCSEARSANHMIPCEPL